MNRHRAFGIGGALLLLSAAPAHAALEWATWTANSAVLATGEFTDGQSATFSGNVDGIDTPAENGTASPAIPGEPSGGNPPGVAALTAIPYPTAIMNPGDFVMAMDLEGVTAIDQAVFALSDMARVYRLELLDAASSALPLGGVTLTNYDLTFPGPTIADFDVALNPTSGWLTKSLVHDGGGAYEQSGLVTFSNLHPQTRFIRITAASLGVQSTEGVHFYLATDVVPEPAADAAALTAFVSLARVRRRRSGRSERAGEGPETRAHP